MTRAKELMECLIQEIESLNRFLKEDDQVKVVKIKGELKTKEGIEG